MQKYVCQNLTSKHRTKLWMGLAEYFCRALFVWIFQIWPYPINYGKTPCPWGHKPSSSAPCAVTMGPSRIGQHIKDEPCAKQRALLGVFSSRYSSVSRGLLRGAPRKVASIFVTKHPYLGNASTFMGTGYGRCPTRRLAK